MTNEELLKLSPKEKCIKIAEACGYKVNDAEAWRDRFVTDPDGQSWKPTDPRISIERLLPNYTLDLNAMHKVEALIPRHNRLRWWNKLSIIVGNEKLADFLNSDVVSATAAQRADAFLLVVDAPLVVQKTPTAPKEHCPMCDGWGALDPHQNGQPVACLECDGTPTRE